MTGLFKNKEKQVQRVVLIETSLIIPNRSQPRVTFSDEELSSLADSIRENGILQPINVRKCGVNYEIVSGERRLRAAKLCGLESHGSGYGRQTDLRAERARAENLFRLIVPWRAVQIRGALRASGGRCDALPI